MGPGISSSGTTAMDKRIGARISNPEEPSSHINDVQGRSSIPLDQLPKGRWERSWPTIACGAGLFSDGYVQSVSLQK